MYQVKLSFSGYKENFCCVHFYPYKEYRQMSSMIATVRTKCVTVQWWSSKITLCLDVTGSLHIKHFLTRGEHREQVATWPHGPNNVSLFRSEHTIHSCKDSWSLRIITVFCGPLVGLKIEMNNYNGGIKIQCLKKVFHEKSL